MKIAIVDTKKAYLPEIEAYLKFFNKLDDFEVYRVYEEDLNDGIRENYDVIWRFMGLDTRRGKNTYVIHEYNSLTVGKFSKLKDIIKKYINMKPDLRIFLNEEIKSKMNFKDQIPYIIRDMGISREFFLNSNVLKKEYDYIYIGSMDKNRRLDKVLDVFRENKSKSILLIGEPTKDLFDAFKDSENIFFEGRVEQSLIPEIASKATYGLNYIPDIYPYNIQTSTKLLEYCALGLKVVTTNYKWLNDFEIESGAKFYKLKSTSDGLVLDFEDVEKFDFFIPDVKEYEWSNILKQSNIIDAIKSIGNNKIKKDN